MKIKTSDLTLLALDWAVFKARHKGAELHYFVNDPFKKEPWLLINGICEMPLHGYTPTADWHQGGPIIEREKINLNCGDDTWGVAEGVWEAAHPKGTNVSFGPTPLIAAMRCYVASKLGDEVEVPEELQ